MREENDARMKWVHEEPLTDLANQLYTSKEWCKPVWSEKREAWMMTRKVNP